MDNRRPENGGDEFRFEMLYRRVPSLKNGRGYQDLPVRQNGRGNQSLPLPQNGRGYQTLHACQDRSQCQEQLQRETDTWKLSYFLPAQGETSPVNHPSGLENCCEWDWIGSSF